MKVLHAARQDIEIFCQQGGVVPAPLFDTQIAAMVCGFGDAASYETLARKLAKVEIDKSARYSDWSHRPLSKRQLEYALADVTHLCTIYEAMTKSLARTGRAAWVEEEIAALSDPALYKLDPKDSWKRLKPRTSNKRFLAMLATLAEWREREAQARDIPRGRVLKDEALTEIAAHPPENAEGLERIRAVPKGFAASKTGQGIAGRDRDRENTPIRPKASSRTPRGASANPRRPRSISSRRCCASRPRKSASRRASSPMPKTSRNSPPSKTKASPRSMAGAPKSSATTRSRCAKATSPSRSKAARRWWWSWKTDSKNSAWPPLRRPPSRRASGAAQKDFMRSQTRAHWVAGSSPAMTN